MAESEVAKLRQQLEIEAESMKQGLYGLAITAQHQIIESKYNAFGACQEQLAALIGEEEATRMAVETYIQVMG
ncbi:MAG TPA: hypothetical protein VKR06_05665 [Ktedonosporobacter sp.]|nr:hypothetical protein [Ktedonosporobacter sp.]